MTKPTNGQRALNPKEGSIDILAIPSPLYLRWQTSITVRYERIVEVFGPPTINGDDKADVRWIIITPHGIASVYNYKNGRRFNGPSGVAIEKIDFWQIRSESRDGGEWTQMTLRPDYTQG